MSRAKPERRVAPGPRGHIVMGNLAAYKHDPIAMLLQLQQQYGDVVRNPLGPFLTHALAHPDYVQQVLQDNQRNYVRGRFYENFKMFFGDGLLTTDGDFWRRHRRCVQPLFHRKEVFTCTNSVGVAATELVTRWRQQPSNAPLDVVEEMMHLSLTMLGQMVFNVDISRHARTVGPAVRFGIQAMMPQGNANDFIPRWVPTRFNRRIAEARKGIDKIISQIIEEHRSRHAERSDLISLLLESRHPESGEPMSDQEVHDEVMTTFLAGHETTGSGLAWALYALAQHPAVLRQLREELDQQLGGRAPTLDDFPALPYLDQFIHESLRVYPPIWGFTRDLVASDEFGGFPIPANSSVFLSPYVTHRHPEFWPNPEAFDPENFAASSAKRHKFAFFPFGGGMRKCIGLHTALLQMRVVIAMVAQHFDLSALPGHPIMRGAFISLRPLNGIRMVIKPRQACQRPGKVTASPPFRNAAPVMPPGTLIGAATDCPVMHGSLAPQPDRSVHPGGLSSLPAKGTGAMRLREYSTSKYQQSLTEPARRFTWSVTATEHLPATSSPSLAGKRVAILNGQPGTAERVAESLARACVKATIFAPESAANLNDAAAEFIRLHGPIDGIVDLTLETAFRLDDACVWEEPMRRSVAMLQASYSDWQVEENVSRLFYVAVTWIDGKMGYGEIPESDHLKMSGQPLGGLWAGLAKTLPQELPNCNIKVIDIAPEDSANVGPYLLAELDRWGLFEIGYRGGRRYTLQAQQMALPSELDMPLKGGDVVLFSGGARGIGLLCARALAEHSGATIIVTGREPLPDPAEPWVQLDEADFKKYEHEQLRHATAQRMPVAIKRELQRLRQRRALRKSIDELREQGLPVFYRVCDVTDPTAVVALCDEIGDALRMVIHNAGIDRPVRLTQKSADSFLDTIRTKVLGFANLCAAVAGRPRLVHFCNVGSLTGRWGGMTGETDYAAANEALARLGMWSHRRLLDCSVKTLVWPTWDGVGMITNLDVTKRYVTPMGLDEGVHHWLRELADDSSAEVMFMGAVGRALTPVQIRGFNPIDGLPNIAALVTLNHHAGTPQSFRPFARFVTRYRLTAEQAPALRSFELDGKAALPTSVLLEHVCAVGDWVIPEGFVPQKLVAAEKIEIFLSALILPSSLSIEIETAATGQWHADEWHVHVCCMETSSRCALLKATLVYKNVEAMHRAPALTGAAWPSVNPVSGPTFELRPASLRRVRWQPGIWPATVWQEVAGGPSAGARLGQVPGIQGATLWSTPHPPVLQLPVSHLETILKAAWADYPSDEDAITHLRIARLAFGDATPTAARFIIRLPDGVSAILDDAGGLVMSLDGLEFCDGHASAISENIETTAVRHLPATALGEQS
jgi:cytochrome P450/NAD(P)-dependent dehydrogenase (short-subunit alcohol dehydrogenase family)